MNFRRTNSSSIKITALLFKFSVFAVRTTATILVNYNNRQSGQAADNSCARFDPLSLVPPASERIH